LRLIFTAFIAVLLFSFQHVAAQDRDLNHPAQYTLEDRDYVIKTAALVGLWTRSEVLDMKSQVEPGTLRFYPDKTFTCLSHHMDIYRRYVAGSFRNENGRTLLFEETDLWPPDKTRFIDEYGKRLEVFNIDSSKPIRVIPVSGNSDGSLDCIKVDGLEYTKVSDDPDAAIEIEYDFMKDE